MNVEKFPEPMREVEVEAAKKLAERYLAETEDNPSRRAQITADLEWFQGVQKVLRADHWDISEQQRAEAEAARQTERYRSVMMDYGITDELTFDGIDVLIRCLKKGSTDVPVRVERPSSAQAAA